VLKCLLSPDVRQLATTSADKTVKLWNLDGFTLDRTLVGAARRARRPIPWPHPGRGGAHPRPEAGTTRPRMPAALPRMPAGPGRSAFPTSGRRRASPHARRPPMHARRARAGVTADPRQAPRGRAGHQRWVWDCVFSVDAAYLVTASSDCSARLWDLSTGDAIRMYSGHHKAAVCCALNDSAIEGRDAD